MPASDRPKNWPSDVTYIPHPVPGPGIPPELRRALLSPAFSRALAGPPPPVRIRTLSDLKHPAFGQRGLVAARALRPRERVVDYVGRVVSDDSEEAAQGDYVLRVGGVAVDAGDIGNEARFVNDYRGVAERPNVEFVERTVQVEGVEISIMSIVVMNRPIRKGEELVVSYGKGFWRARQSQAERHAQNAQGCG